MGMLFSYFIELCSAFCELLLFWFLLALDRDYLVNDLYHLMDRITLFLFTVFSCLKADFSCFFTSWSSKTVLGHREYVFFFF